MRIISSILTLMLSAALAGAQNVSPVAVSNPGFEAGSVLPEDWTVWSSSSAEDKDKQLRRPTEADFIWDHGVSHSGLRSLYIYNEGPRWATWRCSQPVEVRGDTTYRLSVWIRKRGSASTTYVRVRRGGWTTYGIFRPGSNWTQYSFDFKTAPDVESLTIDLSDLGGNGSETWFDDIELVRLSERED